MNSTHLGKGEVRVVLMALEAQVAFVSQEAWDLTIREKRLVKGMFNQTVFKITETLIDRIAEDATLSPIQGIDLPTFGSLALVLYL